MKITIVCFFIVFYVVSIVLIETIRKQFKKFIYKYGTGRPDSYAFEQGIKNLMKLAFFNASSLFLLLASVIYILIIYFSN